MNRDEILKMEAGLEMNELIYIHLFGWTKLPLPAEPRWQKPGERHYGKNPPGYSDNISAAWSVVKKITEMGYRLVIIPGEHVLVQKPAFDDTLLCLCFEEDDSDPKVICQAALIVIMEGIHETTN